MRDAPSRGRDLSDLIHEACRDSPEAMQKAFDAVIGEEVARTTAVMRDLAAAQARADGLALVVEEYRATFERLEASGPSLPSDVSDTRSLRIAVGYSEMVAMKGILDSDPEARAALLMNVVTAASEAWWAWKRASLYDAGPDGDLWKNVNLTQVALEQALQALIDVPRSNQDTAQ